MIDLYTWSTPNGRKASIMLEEVGLAYRVHPVNIGAGEQFRPDFVAIIPNSKIPAIVDSEGPEGSAFTLWESGAILIYLAEKTDSALWPRTPLARYGVLQWLMFQMGSVGPMFGQAHHFLKFAKADIPYAKERYAKETRRLYAVMDHRLGESAHLAQDAYTLADVAIYPWVARFEYHRVDLGEYPNVKRWFQGISARPAVRKGMEVP